MTDNLSKALNRNLNLFLLLSFFEGILVLVILMTIPREGNSGIFLGYSFSRLFLISIVLLISIGFGVVLVWKKHLLPVHQKIERVPSWILAIPFSLSIFFLSHWFFIGVENHLYSYLERLTPLFGYGGVIFFQAIFLIILPEKKHRQVWTWLVFCLYVFSLISILYLIEYAFIDSLFTKKYLANEYSEKIALLFAISISIAVMCFQLFIKKNRHYAQLTLYLSGGIAIIFVVLGYFYYNAASLYAEVNNPSISHSDQTAYIKFSKTAYETDFTYTGNRNRMPIYPYIQAIFYRPEMSDDAFFSQGKELNIILSFLCLIVLFFIFRRYLSLHRATILTLIVAFGVFIFRSPHFTSEVLYYFLSFLGFLGMGLMLIRPSLVLGTTTGILLALAYLTKASNLPAIAAFVFVFFLKVILTIYRKNKEKKPILYQLASLGLMLLIFLSLISPYLLESKKKYGHYFYNINTTFYVWHNTYDEAIHDENLKGHLDHWPDAPADQLPSLKKYIREHNINQMEERLLTGIKAQIGYLANPDTKINYLLIFGGASLFLLISLERDKRKKIIKENWALALFFILNFGGYIFLYGWYYPIGSGGRFIYSIFIPAIFFLFIATDKLAKTDDSPKRISSIQKLQYFDMIILSLLFFNIYYIITTALPSGYFGS